MHLKSIFLVGIIIVVMLVMYLGYRAFNNVQQKLEELETRIAAPPPRSPLTPLSHMEVEEIPDDFLQPDESVDEEDILPPKIANMPNHSLLNKVKKMA
ncbi:unknown [Singapore grouper iridovirus]|uniref:Transmembrane protein n=1 Tax=Singapore grouper iridovirus TaxID=262968 RepID=Q5YFG2_9VIRU|nr:hypothetical protein ORF103R [Singapore grouper iridovirus]AAS18118.1 unknown [Singapore grouper iridovirus]WAU86812.1 hypothetical protein ORF103R [Singapore grouper iridovirus]